MNYLHIMIVALYPQILFKIFIQLTFSGNDRLYNLSLGKISSVRRKRNTILYNVRPQNATKSPLNPDF